MRLTIVWIFLLFLINTATAEPVKTFPELLEKIQEHREMIKDASGTINYGYDENDPMEILNHFVYVDGKWLLCSEITRDERTYNDKLKRKPEKLVKDINYSQFTGDSIEFSYNPKSGIAVIDKHNPNNDSPFNHMTSPEGDQMPFIGVDTYGWIDCQVDRLSKGNYICTGDTKTSSTLELDNGLVVASFNNGIKLWFDPEKQYSIVRCVREMAFERHQSEIEMVPIGNPPVYFPKKATEHSYHIQNNELHFCGTTVILYENIKINTGRTEEDLKIKLPMGTKVYESSTGTAMKTTAENVTLDQILASKDVITITED